MSRFAALQYRDFRLLWSGDIFSSIGTQMQLTAVNWHVFKLLEGQSYAVSFLGRQFELGAEALGLGALGIARFIPIVIFALIGGALADTIDRRRLLIWAQALSLVVAGILALLTSLNIITIPLLYLLTAALSALAVIANPAQQSLVPNLVPVHHLPNAVSLNTLRFYGATILGPALAGLLISYADLATIYWINALSFGAILWALSRMVFRRITPPQKGVFTPRGVWDGLKFTFSTPMIASTMLIDFVATFFSSSRTMLPLIATQVLGLGEVGYGVLGTAQPVGAVIAGIYLANKEHLRQQGKLLLLGVTVYGMATALFGITTIAWLAYFFFALTGAGDTLSTVIRGTIRQLNTPDDLRGRMTGTNMMFAMGGPQLGELEAGLVASAFGAPLAIVTGGIATVLLTAFIAWYYPQLRNYDS